MNLRLALFAAALTAASLAWGEAPDAPERIAQLTYAEGEVTFRGAQAPASNTLPDRPLARGDRLATGRGARAEIALDTASVRLNEQTTLTVVGLDATTVRLELDTGTASLALRDLLENEAFEIATPNTVITLDRPGDYRVDVASDESSFLSVHGGGARVATAGGPVRVADGQRVRIAGRDAIANLETPRPADAFDDWVLEREVKLAEAQPSPDDAAYEELDHYGEWQDDANYGRVWMPSYAYGGYDPFRYGYWQQSGFGSIWIGSMPWSGYTNHSGRWTYLHHLNRWCWQPTRPHHGPVVALETHPFGHPRNPGSQRDDDDRQPVANTAELPRRIDADLSPVYIDDRNTGKSSRGRIVVPRSNPVSSAPAQPVAAPSSSSPSSTPSRTAPMGPSRTSTARPSGTSSTMTSQPTRESGARPLP